jgi:hypothetical protein
MLERGKNILVLSRAVQDTFTSSEWTEIGYLTGMDEWIDRHPRLLRSLNWGDPDYKGHAMDAVARILDQDPANLKILVEYEPIVKWLKKHEPGALSELQAEVSRFGVFPMLTLRRQPMPAFWHLLMHRSCYAAGGPSVP